MVWGVAAVCPMVGGCLPASKVSFDSPDPNRRLDAIARAGEGGEGDLDPGTLRALVGQLEATDPAARMLAIRALERRTGQTLGYDASDPEWKRTPAVRRWKEYAGDPADDGAPAGP